MTMTEATWFSGQELSSAAAEDGDRRGHTYLEAIRFALEDELSANPAVVLLGEDIGTMGGAFRVTQGLFERFGDTRVIDTPIAEAAIVGAGIGLAITGWCPIVELQFADFISCAYDQLVSEAAKLYFRFGISVPLVVRAPSGGGVGAGPFHSQSPEGIFAHVPGLKIVCPGDVQDAYDLLRAAIADPNPVLYFEHKHLYRSLKGPVIRHSVIDPLGQALVRVDGEDLTIVTYGGMVPRCIEAARALQNSGIRTEVVDLRTVHPFDSRTVFESVRKTSKVMIVHEDTLSSGIGAEIAAQLANELFYDLDTPIIRVAAPDTPVPFARVLEDEYVPSVERIIFEAKGLAER